MLRLDGAGGGAIQGSMAKDILREQDLHVHDRIMQLWAAVANLQAQAWAATMLLNRLAKVEGMPKEAVDLLNSYGQSVWECRARIPIEQSPPKSEGI